jgi:hypothetical protein
VSLFHRIERALETISRASTPLETVQQTAHCLAQNFAEGLGIRRGRICAQDDSSHELVATFGSATKAPVAIVDRAFSDITEYSRTTSPVDHQTIIVVKHRPQKPEEAPA